MFSAKDARLMSDYNREKEYFKQKKYEKKFFKKLVKRINNAIKQSIKKGRSETELLVIDESFEDTKEKLNNLYRKLGYKLEFDCSSAYYYKLTVRVTW